MGSPPHLKKVWVGMDPALQICQLIELRHFELLGKLDFLSIVFQGGVEALGGDLAIMRDADDLCFEEVSLLPFKFGVGVDRGH